MGRARGEDERLLHGYLLARSQAAPGTRALIQSRGRKWVAFLAGRGRSLMSADAEDATALMIAWDRMQWSPHTKRCGISILRTMHEWLVDNAGAPRNPWANVQGARQPHVPRMLDDELAALDGALAQPTVRDLRDRAILRLFAAGGIRNGELCALNVADLDLPRQSCIVYGRSSRERRIDFSAETAEALRRWLAIGRPAWARRPGVGAVFIGRQGGRIGPTAIRDALTHARHCAYLQGHLRPPLGHEDPATTQVFVNIEPTGQPDERMRVAQGQPAAGAQTNRSSY